MVSRTLQVIPKPPEGEASIMAFVPGSEETRFFIGVGDGAGVLDYLCGKCAAVLAESVSHAQIQGVVLCCSKCGSYNKMPDVNQQPNITGAHE